MKNHELVRYCPECGTMSEEHPAKPCCPDHSHSQMVRADIAVHAYTGFMCYLSPYRAYRRLDEIKKAAQPQED